MRFPIMRVGDMKYGTSRSVDWAMIALHELQAKYNHDQTLKRLAERGGLDPSEAIAVLRDRNWHEMDIDEAISQLAEFDYREEPTP